MGELLEGIRVLELAGNVAGPFAGKLLAEYGAEVTKVEPPTGDPARHHGPFKDDVPDPETSLLFLHLNRNKRSVTANLEHHDGRELVRRLIADVDIVIEDFRPGQLAGWGLDWQTLAERRPGLVMASITPFGQTGPWRNYRGSEITLQAIGGPLHQNGAPYREPVKSGGYVAHVHAGIAVAYACVLARLRVELGGKGDHIDQAVYEAQAGFRDRRTISLTAASYIGRAAKRQPPGSRTALGVRPAADGYVNIFAGGTKHFAEFLDIIERPDLREHEDFGKPLTGYSQEYAEQVEGSYLAWLIQRPKREAVALTQAVGLLGGAILSTEDLTTDPHYRERGVWEEIDHPVAGRFEYPGRQLILSETPRPPARRAPLLGEHNAEVYCGIGYAKTDLARLRAQGAI